MNQKTPIRPGRRFTPPTSSRLANVAELSLAQLGKQDARAALSAVPAAPLPAGLNPWSRAEAARTRRLVRQVRALCLATIALEAATLAVGATILLTLWRG